MKPRFKMAFICGICLDGFAEDKGKSNLNDSGKDQDFVSTSCGHLFHLSCVTSWFLVEMESGAPWKSCPLCKLVLNKEHPKNPGFHRIFPTCSENPISLPGNYHLPTLSANLFPAKLLGEIEKLQSLNNLQKMELTNMKETLKNVLKEKNEVLGQLHNINLLIKMDALDNENKYFWGQAMQRGVENENLIPGEAGRCGCLKQNTSNRWNFCKNGEYESSASSPLPTILATTSEITGNQNSELGDHKTPEPLPSTGTTKGKGLFDLRQRIVKVKFLKNMLPKLKLFNF